MSLMSLARRIGFWALDYLRGGEIRADYKEIRRVDSLDSSDPEINRLQSAQWEKLRDSACKYTEYYRGMTGKDLSDFPIINKMTIRTAQDSFLSQKYARENLIQMSTSGSTGTPFICYQNAGKKKRVNAEAIYYSEKVGYRLGDNLSYIRTIVKQNSKTGLKQFMQNQTLINCMSLDDQGISGMIDAIRRVSNHGKVTLLGYGSTYTAICDYAKKNQIKVFDGVNVTGVISGSDMLFDQTRSKIADLFGKIPVVSRYSNEENGIIGQDEGINNVFSINESDYIVAICDDEGNSLPEGDVGRIIVTDLYNEAMPMIRYDTGDMGAIKTFEINGRKKRCICSFSGRSVDLIRDTKGSILSPHAITNHMWSFPEIVQYQLIQKDPQSYEIRLNVPDDFRREDELMEVLYRLLGKDASIRIERVDEIPVLASGKRRYIVNEMNNH